MIRSLLSSLFSREEYLILALDPGGLPLESPACVRRISPGDAYVSEDLRELGEALAARGETGIGYYEDETIVAFLWLRRGGVEDVGRESVRIPGGCAVIHYFNVDPARRGGGIGTKLLNGLSRSLLEPTDGTLAAFVHRENTASLRAFSKAKFAEVGRLVSRQVLSSTTGWIEGETLGLTRERKVERRSALVRALRLPFTLASRANSPRSAGLGRSDGLPALLHAQTDLNELVSLPCSVSPGRRFWRFRVRVEPDISQELLAAQRIPAHEIVSAVAGLGRSRWLEEIEWGVPAWMGDEVRAAPLPACAEWVRPEGGTWTLRCSRETADPSGAMGALNSGLRALTSLYFRAMRRRYERAAHRISAG